MVQWHMKSRRKPSGGILHTVNASDKRLCWRGGEFSSTAIAHEDDDILVELAAGTGNTEKQKAKAMRYVSVFDEKGGKAVKAEILSVEANRAHEHFIRANILTKGAIIKVKIGPDEKFARITSRPGQAGTVSAVIADYMPPVKKKKVLKEKKAKPVKKEKEAGEAAKEPEKKEEAVEKAETKEK